MITKELVQRVCDVFTLNGEVFCNVDYAWTSEETGEWFYILVRGCLWCNQLDKLREFVYVSSIAVSCGRIQITCNENPSR